MDFRSYLSDNDSYISLLPDDIKGEIIMLIDFMMFMPSKKEIEYKCSKNKLYQSKIWDNKLFWEALCKKYISKKVPTYNDLESLKIWYSLMFDSYSRLHCSRNDECDGQKFEILSRMGHLNTEFVVIYSSWDVNDTIKTLDDGADPNIIFHSFHSNFINREKSYDIKNKKDKFMDKIMPVLINRGLNFNIITNFRFMNKSYINTPIVKAISIGNVEYVEYILKYAPELQMIPFVMRNIQINNIYGLVFVLVGIFNNENCKNFEIKKYDIVDHDQKNFDIKNYSIIHDLILEYYVKKGMEVPTPDFEGIDTNSN